MEDSEIERTDRGMRGRPMLALEGCYKESKETRVVKRERKLSEIRRVRYTKTVQGMCVYGNKVEGRGQRLQVRRKKAVRCCIYMLLASLVYLLLIDLQERHQGAKYFTTRSCPASLASAITLLNSGT